MAPLNPPIYQQAGTYPARYDRLGLAAMLAPLQGTGPLAIRPGVRPSPANAGLQVTQRSTPAMFVTIGAGSAFIQSASATGGVYIVHNDAAHDVAIATAHATLGRKDLIVARIYDAEVSGSANEWKLEAITGTPAGSPATPATPSGALALAVVTVNAAASTIVNANIADSRVYTAALGGAIPAPAASLPANPYTGMPAYDTTNLLPKWYSGAAWKGWQDEGYMTSAALAAYLSSNGYIRQSDLDSAGYKTTQYVIKPSTESVPSSTTPQPDDHLVLPVTTNAIYWVETFCLYDGPTGADLQIGWTGPAGAQLDWVSDLIATTASSGVDAVSRSAQAISNLPSGGSRGTGTPTVAPMKGLLQTAGTAGNLQIRWAQAVSDAVAIRMLGNSLLMLTRLA